MIDKLNHLDYCWYVVRTRPRQEKKFVKLLEQYKAKSKNILEVYAPTHTTSQSVVTMATSRHPCLWELYLYLLPKNR